VEAAAMKVSIGTAVLLAGALASVVLVHADPWQREGDAAGFVSTRSAAKRVFPRAADITPETVEIAVRPADGAATRLVPTDDGHIVLVDDVEIGPADPEAVEGLWASLRMATTLRAVTGEVEIGAAQKGEIEIAIGNERYAVKVGGPAPDGSGLYGEIVEGEAESVWVVEEELGTILEQRPEAWLARRTLVVEPGQVTAIAWADAQLQRGDDGLWRSKVGDTTAILSTDAVEARIDRLVSARLDPLLPDHDEEGDPFVSLQTVGERTLALTRGGSCPGHDDRVVVRRGAGWAGCIDAALVEPWPLPGRPGPDAGRLVEPRLLPHPPERVMRIEMRKPDTRTLRRTGGDWALEEVAASTTVTDAPGDEVFRWYGALHDAEVEAQPELAVPDAWDVEIVVHLDSLVQLELRCVQRGELLCRRDAGPMLRVRTPDLVLAFARDTFVDRQLLAFPTEEAIAIEITGPRVERQSVHFDMGVWRLDAPTHPDEDNALSEIRLESLVAALAGLRAEAWVAAPGGDPLRTIRIELTPSQERRGEHVVALHEGCVVALGDRAAQVSASACRRLGTDLLHDDPLKFWIESARSIEVGEDGSTVRFERDGEVLATADDGAGPARERLTALSALRATAMVPGDPSGARRGTLRVLPRSGAAFDVHYGDAWARIDGADWHYALALPKKDAEEEEDEATEPEPE
jgi:hypothetical protein